MNESGGCKTGLESKLGGDILERDKGKDPGETVLVLSLMLLSLMAGDREVGETKPEKGLPGGRRLGEPGTHLLQWTRRIAGEGDLSNTCPSTTDSSIIL